MGNITKVVYAAALGLLMAGQTFAATGGSFYSSQLSSIGAGNVSYGRTSDWTSTGYTLYSPLTDALDLQAGQWAVGNPPHATASAYTTVDQPSFMEWDLPSGTFNAQTVIAFRNSTFAFSTGSPWHLEMFDGSAWQPVSGVAGAGAPSDGSIVMGNPGITNGTKIRAIYDNLNFGGSYFLSMGEIVVLPDQLQTVTNSYTATASSQYNASYGASKGIDNQLGDNHSWFSTPGDSNAWYTLTFTTPARIDALLLSKFDNYANYSDAVVDIYANGTLGGGWINGTKVAGGVDMVSPSGFGSFNVFKFDSPLIGVNSLSLKFTNGGRSLDGGQGLGEIMPLAIPEPNAATLVGLTGALLLRRRRIHSFRA